MEGDPLHVRSVRYSWFLFQESLYYVLCTTIPPNSMDFLGFRHFSFVSLCINLGSAPFSRRFVDRQFGGAESSQRSVLLGASPYIPMSVSSSLENLPRTLQSPRFSCDATLRLPTGAHHRGYSQASPQESPPGFYCFPELPLHWRWGPSNVVAIKAFGDVVELDN